MLETKKRKTPTLANITVYAAIGIGTCYSILTTRDLVRADSAAYHLRNARTPQQRHQNANELADAYRQHPWLTERTCFDAIDSLITHNTPIPQPLISALEERAQDENVREKLNQIYQQQR
ncbi:hypothetical protein HY489_06085 [Candidatus Woesearchaeota archaeon]|nr:hypothetical protein [Candidatus Woesearchaeota archaeon]